AACRAWLFRIARNLFLDGKRAAAGRSQLALAPGMEAETRAFSPSAETVERLTALELEQALARLPSEQREAFPLVDLWGFRYSEIAKMVGSPIGTIRSRIARGRAGLSALLAGKTGQQPRNLSRP